MNTTSQKLIHRIMILSLSLIFIVGCAGKTTRVSITSSEVEGNAASFSSSVSGDGRYVAFDSTASNLVPADSNGVSDVFVRDRTTGTTMRVSVSSAGQQANAESYLPSISVDGRYVAFSSAASNLVSGDTNADPFSKFEAFVHDRVTGQTVRVNINSAGTQGNIGSTSARPSISADGRFVAFQSRASNLVAGDTNNTTDIFVHDLTKGKTFRVSVNSSGAQGNRWSDTPSISADGRYVSFRSGADNLVPGDTNNVCDMGGDPTPEENCPDVFIHDRLTKETTRVSVSSNGTEGNGQSYAGDSGATISADGRFVAFNSGASNLVPGDTNDMRDFFVRDRLYHKTVRVSVDSDGNQGLGAIHSGPGIAISANGQFVAFAFDAPLVSSDTSITNPDTDIFVRDLKRGKTTMVSVNSDGNEAVRPSANPSISASGRFVSFFSAADNLVVNDTNNAQDVFLRERGRYFECGLNP